jgi:5-hydroxyisourate hydrolase
MSPITTHVLDTSRGRPAVGIEVALEILSGKEWKLLGNGLTDATGRCTTLLQEGGQVVSGTYRLVFNVAPYYEMQRTETLFGTIPIVFEIAQPEAHYHVPLLISPFGYSTYRGT